MNNVLTHKFYLPCVSIGAYHIYPDGNNTNGYEGIDESSG